MMKMTGKKRAIGALVVGVSLFFLVAPPAFASSAAADQSAAVADAVDAQLEVAAEDGHGGGHGGDPLSREKLQDFGWRIVNFIPLLMLLVYFMGKPLGRKLSSRREGIIKEIAELEARREKAEKSYDELQEKLAAVESDIDKIVDRAVAQAEVEKKSILEKAEAAAEEMKRSAQQAVANEVAEARLALRGEVAEKAAAMAQQLIKKNLKADDHKKIIENYLDKVGAMS